MQPKTAYAVMCVVLATTLPAAPGQTGRRVAWHSSIAPQLAYRLKGGNMQNTDRLSVT